MPLSVVGEFLTTKFLRPRSGFMLENGELYKIKKNSGTQSSDAGCGDWLKSRRHRAVSHAGGGIDAVRKNCRLRLPNVGHFLFGTE